jgi:AcrR family transcriptional regulator
MGKATKSQQTQSVAVRTPRQERSRHKIELMLEAAMRLLDKGGYAALTTNAIAATAGVSIGTLYQYFPNKAAILDTLAEREVASLSERITAVMTDAAPLDPQARVARIVRAVAAGYGRRNEVHRLVMEHSLGRGSQRLTPTINRLIELMTADARPGASGPAAPMSHAEAFVVSHAFVGVMRAMIIGHGKDGPPPEEIERAMARMLTSFVAAGRSSIR